MSVDQKCIDLARHFLATVEGATAADLAELAEAIQAVCEDVCREIEERAT